MEPVEHAGQLVGEIGWLGEETVIVGCRKCPHRQVANLKELPDSVPLWLIAAQFVCPRCQQSDAYVLPNLDAEPSQESPAPSTSEVDTSE